MPIGVRGTRVIPLTALAAYYGGLPPDPATVLASLQRVTRALRLLYERTGIIDNSTCALCGRQRLWATTPHKRRMIAPCENSNCLSREIEALLDLRK
jgi:hypothetical protein